MIEDIEKYKGTILIWSALGGGSISLPYLEHEAYGEIDPRLRLYGFMNDSEFIAECSRRGIKVFGIVFEVQGWEFPAVFNEDGTELKKFNVIGKDDEHDWYGLREFTAGKHDGLFGKSLKDYFPEGLYNSNNEMVTDIWEECAARDYNGKPVHSNWVEVKNHKHIAYQMCRNNPVWRSYLKKIIEIQIDAGVPGIQLDECELPMTSMQDGGCFCNDCRKQFREYLKELKANGKLNKEYDDINLDTFDYKEYLNERDISFPNDPKGVPLFREYWEFQVRAVKKYFSELVNYAKEYGMRKGKNILVSGNFFNLMPVYYPIEDKVDIIITEMRQTIFRQPYWYRYAAGFAGDKTIIVAENPYGGIVPEMVEMLDRGKGYDLYRLFLLEASVYGCNMAVPYGAWMGNTIKNSFNPPADVTEEVQGFLSSHEDLYSKRSGSDIMVLYSFPSYYWRETASGYSGNLVDDDRSGLLSYRVDDINSPDTSRLPFWEVIKCLSDNQINYDVKFAADGELKRDDLCFDDIKNYKLIILPDCEILTKNQTEVLRRFAEGGSELIILGRAAENIPGWLSDMKGRKNVLYCENTLSKVESLENFSRCFSDAYEGVWQVKVDNPNVGVQMHRTADGLAIHLLNYSYSKEKDAMVTIPQLKVKLREGGKFNSIKMYTPDDRPIKYSCESDGTDICLTLYNLPIYVIIGLHEL